MKSRRRYLWAMAGLVLVLAGRSGAAVDPIPRPLPDFSLTKLDGTTVSSTQLPMQDKWFLIFTMADCGACDTFLRLVNKNELPDVPAHVVVVVSGATPAKVQDMMPKFPDLAASTWYADPSKNAAKQLKLPGIPVLFGLRQNTLQWCILGVLSNDTTKMKSILSAWIQTHKSQ